MCTTELDNDSAPFKYRMQESEGIGIASFSVAVYFMELIYG